MFYKHILNTMFHIMDKYLMFSGSVKIAVIGAFNTEMCDGMKQKLIKLSWNSMNESNMQSYGLVMH